MMFYDRYICERLDQILIVGGGRILFIEHFCYFFVKSAFLHYRCVETYSFLFFFMTESSHSYLNHGIRNYNKVSSAVIGIGMQRVPIDRSQLFLRSL